MNELRGENITAWSGKSQVRQEIFKKFKLMVEQEGGNVSSKIFEMVLDYVREQERKRK
jgi:hypothetical protein